MPNNASVREIVIRPETAGWSVSCGLADEGRFAELQAAYEHALALCARLFDRGVVALVRQTV